MARITPAEAGPPPRPREDFGDKVKAHTRYFAADGKRLPSVTTIVKLVDDQSHLIRWSNDLGLLGIDSEKYRNEAARVGDLAHELVRREVDGLVPNLDDYTANQLKRAEYSLGAFRAWRAQHKLEPVLVEHPMVSEQHRFGGQIDCLCRLDGALTLVDFKTSGAIYFSHRVQVAAYWWLLQEAGHKVKGVRILGIGRNEHDETTDKILTGQQVLDLWEIFRRAREIYELKKAAEKDAA